MHSSRGVAPPRPCLATLAAILVTLWLAVAAPSGDALAGQGGSATAAAGFIVDTGEGEPIHVVVTFDDASMNAVELLRATDLDVVTVEFGGLGEAVCSIVETGCDVGTCRQRVCQTGDPESPFWQYWEQDPEEGWKLSPLGASHAEIADGDIAAWVWTGVEPELEPLAWDELVERAGAPAELAQGGASGEPAVYSSLVGKDEDDGTGRTGTLAAVGIVAAVAVFGGWLVVRNRREQRAAE
ncbi:MAG TPA: hypothetical protein VD789_01375 [Thermomicrobiales bacterium]|nr:hypothetical protein [Thermomicrobiales bacterium]